MNPVIIIVSAALFLSVAAISIINKPKKPVTTGAVIIILICFVVFTFMIDRSINMLPSGESNSFVCFLTMSDTLTYDGLAESFRIFMYTDIGLIAASLVSLFVEIMLILKKDNES